MPKFRKILFLVDADISTGSGKSVTELVQLMKANSFCNPVVLTLQNNGVNVFCDSLEIENYSIEFGRTCSIAKSYLGHLMSCIRRPFVNRTALRFLKGKNLLDELDAVCSNTSTIDFGAYLYKILHIPHIWQIREFLVFNRDIPPIIGNLPGYISKNSSKVITVSKKIRDYCVDRCEGNEKFITIYDGVSGIIKEKKYWNNSSIRLLCVGEISKLKGQDVLVSAFLDLPENIRKEFTLDFVGGGNQSLIEELKEKICAHGASQYVSFKGFSNQIRELLPNYDVGVQPSHSEGFSRVIVEYMLAGLCVVATEGNAESIKSGENGFLYNSSDQNALKNILIQLYEKKSLIKEYGCKARVDAMENYCIEKNYSKICDVFESCLKK